MGVSDKPLSMAQRKHHFYLTDALRRFEWDMHSAIFMDQRIPLEWREIAARRDSAKTRITVRLDEDVVKWFRSMGPGYQPRMNDVLRAFMHARLSGLLKADDTIEPFRESGKSEMAPPRWGDADRFMGEE
jgi:uncharacterized protein (DUF4415 family)